jgi:pyridoxamine 5'-phosphate oxidase
MATVERSDLDDDPLRQLSLWLEAAKSAGAPSPEAMTLATVAIGGGPTARLVILRSLDRGLVFFTDYGSDKGTELEADPRAAAVFHWHLPEHRQVRVTGTVERVSDEESDNYWDQRPPGARRNAAASHQSEVVASRAELEARAAALARRYPDDTQLPRPDRWGGYRLKPTVLELWQEAADGLHDRIRYQRGGDGWTVERLSP